MPHLLLTGFPLVIPLAKVLTRLGAVGGSAVVVVGVGWSAWFGAHLLDVWPCSI